MGSLDRAVDIILTDKLNTEVLFHVKRRKVECDHQPEGSLCQDCGGSSWRAPEAAEEDVNRLEVPVTVRSEVCRNWAEFHPKYRFFPKLKKFASKTLLNYVIDVVEKLIFLGNLIFYFLLKNCRFFNFLKLKYVFFTFLRLVWNNNLICAYSCVFFRNPVKNAS